MSLLKKSKTFMKKTGMKTSNLIALIGAALLFFMSVVFQTRIHYHIKKERKAGYGAMVSEIRDLAHFDRLYIDQKIKVVFIQDPTSALKVFAPREVLDSVITSVIDEELKVTMTRRMNTKDTVKVVVSNQTLEAIELVGGYFENQGTLNAERFHLKMDKNSDCSLKLNAKVLEISMDKNATLDLKGKTEDIRFINQ